MNGTIAQAIALTCHGNASLAGRPPSAPFSSNSTTQFCDAITFVTLKEGVLRRKPKEVLVASTPDEWFDYLAQSGAKAIQLSHGPSGQQGISDRMSSGFVGGGGEWLVNTFEQDGSCSSWCARWEVWNQEAPENRIWRVTYGRVSQVADHPPAEVEETQLGAAADRLASALRDIKTFAVEHQCGFVENFQRAEEALTGSKLESYHQDLAPADWLSNSAASLLDACQSAWVFGGMGSWNDMGFRGEVQDQYERISEALFQAVIDAMVAGANASIRTT